MFCLHNKGIVNMSLSSALNKYSSSISKIEVLSKEDFNYFSRKFLAGCKESKAAMIKHNLRSVVKCARKYKQDEETTFDLVQEGNLGLIRAVEKFDPELGNSFTTYSERWICSFIEDYINKNKHIVHVPMHTLKLSRKVEKTIAEFEKMEVKWNVADISKKTNKEERKIKSAISLLQKNSSLNIKVSDDDKSLEIIDLIKDESIMENDDSDIEHAKNWLYSKLEQLSENEKNAMIYFYGLCDTEELTGADTGNVMGLSRQRVSKLLQNGREKIFKISKKENVDITYFGL